MTQVNPDQELDFDFARHEQAAVSEYLRVVGFYTDLATSVKRIAEEILKRREIRVHSIEARAKDPSSFGKKASKPSKDDPNRPMYANPVEQITDKAAIRIITFFPRTIEEINDVLHSEFSIIEHFDKGESLIEEEKFGYQSVHYLVRLAPVRTSLPEYERFKGAVVEVQVRTILQHAWAEIEHDIQYKSSATIPKDVKRRFMSLAGLLEIADREFQAVQDADRDITERAEALISVGQFKAVEITSASLKAYLDKKLGPDGRMKEWSYDWTARLLLTLGFSSLDQVDECISPYSDAELSRLIDGWRQGQLSRFEYMLLAGMGNQFLARHPWRELEWFSPRREAILEMLAANKIRTGWYDPISAEHTERKAGPAEDSTQTDIAMGAK